ncbi:hypothetical protein LTR10_015480 [Elasticomyces elasticus]|uniref:DUF1330 domain-containing protein n=1 Tax=Exophiala sideris TaxID=1016849 RepID=A0ABR0J4L0_9EURO|nr:hypothetical protein LTR10_015480 [Elasticomyces elasticus]KAK5026928.1 hypothetical protein LTS07_007227 [Exophiala sideris]KAK5033932.1 hypothetical protein LTR13_006532 [Exophiala sideris]KAK5055793.1 hypothetical protein LTR69_008168 [Exophiala sideris]KAK5180874.1 hypothetical protein LTR44_006694 [Eurotiomycetes sp. CCFEE 6388]
MVAYMILICQELLNRDGLLKYWEKIGPTIAPFQPKPLVMYNQFDQIDGDPVEGVALIEFPSADEAHAWYASEEYKKIQHFRTENTRFISIIVEAGSLPVAQRMLGKQPDRTNESIVGPNR